MSTKHTPGPWHVAPAIGHPGRYRVQRKNGGSIEVRKSASGRDSIFKTLKAASRTARCLNYEAAVEAELRAKYAGQPPLPNLTLGAAIAKSTGA